MSMLLLTDPDKVCVISHHQGIQKTYKELRHDVDRLAVSLLNMGLRKGDVAGAWSANVYEYLVIQYACSKIGVIVCSINPAYKTSELEYALAKAKHKVLFMPTKDSRQSVVNDFHGIISKVDFSKTPHLKHIVFLESKDEDLTQWSDSHFPHTFDSLLCNQGNVPVEVTDNVVPEDLATIYFTSGTTGKPKGATSTQFSIINNMRIARIHKRTDSTEEVRTLIPLPFFHVYAGMIGIFSICLSPSTIVLNDVRYSAKSVSDCISKYKCTDVWTVPTMLVDIQNYLKKRSESYDLSSLRSIGCGAAPVPPELVRESQEIFPNLQNVLVGYGATEMSAIGTYPNPGTPQAVINETVGTPQDFTMWKIIDTKTEKMVKHEETGELLVKGFSVMAGYLDDPEKTAESVRNGWYHTGDLATMDSKGRFKIVGRTKEMIIRGGENIYPREIEDLLHEHPEVLEVAVCGIPHNKLGEEVVAWVQLTDPVNSKITAEDIREYCRNRITYFKVPQYVFFVDSFPVTGSGKYQKFIMTQKSLEMLKEMKEKQSSHN